MLRGKIQRLVLISDDQVTSVPELGAAGDVTKQEESLAVEPGIGEGT